MVEGGRENAHIDCIGILKHLSLECLMTKWKKSFRNLPAQLAQEIENLPSEDVKVFAGKIISAEEVADGVYAHLGITSDTLVVGSAWETLPPVNVGIRSKKNSEGWEDVRKDLPKIKKYFYHDIPVYGNYSNWTTVAIPREVYERDVYPPYLFHIEVKVQEKMPDGKFGVVFSVDEIFSKVSPTFDLDIFFAINLLQENSGVSGVTSAENPEFVFTSDLDWELFPPGDVDAVISALSSGKKSLPEGDVRDRLQLFSQYQPKHFLKGLGGNDHYIGAQYADDLVVFENMKYGNALYVLYGDWEALSKKPRSELLKLSSSQFDRIIHTNGWEQIFATLMQKELHNRGIRIRIGRHMRRRRR